MNETFVELPARMVVGDVELAWGEWGASGGGGPDLVLCHGFSGSAHDFALEIEALSARRRVVAFDHRGHGRSTKAGSVTAYTLDRLAEDVVGLLASVAAAPVDLLGHSMGGQVALRVTLARPDLIRSLVLMDTSAWSFVPADSEQAAALTGFLAAYDPSRGLPDMSALVTPEDALIEAATPAAWRARKEELSAAFDPYALKALGPELFAPERISLRARLGEVRCPVTVLVGSEDHPLSDQAEELAAAVADGELIVIDGAYHSPQLTHPSAWRGAVESHLARVSPVRS
jgi:pimeloyl-ACP methyl ester carboxylesterase